MTWLSESVELLVAGELRGADGQPKVHDALVVGSGYGGAVSALRLAQAGVQVLVLERGKEYLAGDFPNDVGEAFGHVRMDRNAGGNIDGYESGLYDLRLGDGIGALVGNALGGTSQINGNVVLRPDPRVFTKQRDERPAWPAALVPGGDGAVVPSLEAGYQRAVAMLAPETFTDTQAWVYEQRPGGRPTEAVKPLKRQRLEKLGDDVRAAADPALKVSFEPVDLAVRLGKGDDSHVPPLHSCQGCGECVSGCNLRAKKTLTYTYLPQARKAGARMFTGATVLSIRKLDDGHWIVSFVRTETRKMQRTGVEVPVHELHARHVVLAAGTFGSTEILARSGQSGSLEWSDRLGQHLSTNGDFLAFGYMLKDRVNGIGVGSATDRPAGYAVGPTITGMIRVDNPNDVTGSTLIQDGAIPRAIAGLFQEMVATSATLVQLDSWGYRDMPAAGTPAERSADWAALQTRASANTLTLLGIGHDPSAGGMRLDRVQDRLKLSYPKGAIARTDELHELHMRRVADQDGIYLDNPALKPLPQGVSRILSGPVMDNGTFTVHPLGGCCMADTHATGVVNDLGEVFDPLGGGVHTGLYVLDGSIVSTSLGANPLLAITALAERAMAQLAPRIAGLLDRHPAPVNDIGKPRFTAQPPANPHRSEVNVHFTESLRARNGALRWHEEDCDAHLLLHMPVDDLSLFGADGRHLIPIPNQYQARRQDKEQLAPHLSIDVHEPADAAGNPPLLAGNRVRARLLVESGWVSILPVPRNERLASWSAFARTALTWWFTRGFEEITRRLLGRDKDTQPDPVGWIERLRSLLKLCRHASESRGMEYHLRLRDEQPHQDSIRTYTLEGEKQVGYPASWTALLRYIFLFERPLRRTNVWKAFGELDVRITNEDGKQVGAGTLQLDMLDMTRMHAPQLAPQRDTPNALLALAGYPLWFARLLAKTRLWDFRLPDYPTEIPPELIPRKDPRWPHIAVPPADEAEPKKEGDLPPPDQLWPDFPALRIYEGTGGAMRLVAACASEPLCVRRSQNDGTMIELKLTRYPQPKIAHEPCHNGARQFKTLLMLNGFAQSTLGFVPQEHQRKPGQPDDEAGLAEFFYEQGFDVWLFDYRTSSILEASKEPCSMDDIARYDIPEAVARVIDVMKEECKSDLEDGQDIQIYAFAHCVGAASLAMSLLGGYLKHPSGKDKLAGVTFSQMQAFLVGGRTAQMRLRVGSFLRDTMGIEYLRLSAAERQPNALESVLDRLFASLPTDPGEDCPGEHNRLIDRPDICTCKRMSGTISRLLKHDRIKPQTHQKLPVYFGRANTSLLVHGGRCVENERLVNADGQNVYVTDANIRNYLNLPVAILHGAHNALFDVESARRTWEQFRRVHPKLEAAQVCTKIIAKDYGHFDCTIGYGKDMQEQILKPLREFYGRAWTYQRDLAASVVVPDRVPRLRAKAPLSGPVVGWTRTQKRDGKIVRLVRLWMEVDDSEADPADFVVTHCLGAQPETLGPGAQQWPVIRVPLRHKSDDIDQLQPTPDDEDSHKPYIAIALADLEFDITAGWQHDVTIRMFSVHTVQFKREPSTRVARPQQGDGPADPLSADDIVRGFAGGDIPLFIPIDGNELAGPVGAEPAATSSCGARGQTVPAKPFPSDVAKKLWRGLARIQRVLQARARRPEPDTLSRKFRQLALPLLRKPGLASLKAEIVRGPDAGSGLVFVASSCRHPGLAFEDRRADASLAHIARHLDRTPARPSFMLMLGDQIYADATANLMDSPSAIEKIVLGHQRAFRTTAFIDLTSQLPTYMVIDDHEIGDSWSRDLMEISSAAACTIRGLRAQDEARNLFETARAAFAAYQWAHGPRNGNVDVHGVVRDKAPGFNYHFEEGGCPFFVLDSRTQRTRFGPAPQVCHPDQLRELATWLGQFTDRNDRRPKFIVSGSVFAPGLRMEHTGVQELSDLTSDTWQMAQVQRKQVLEMIAAQGIRNVVFLSGDYHCAATAKLQIGADLNAYAIVTPPLYAQLPAANVKQWQILSNETLTLGDGTKVKIKAKPCHGDGFAEIRALPLVTGKWQLEIGLFQMDTSRKDPERNDWPRSFTLD